MKPVELSPRLLQQFCVLAEEKHFGRAADRLLISQPSLSQAIGRLEQCLGIMLLSRTSRTVELTAAGKAFAIDIEGVLEAQHAAVARARRVANGEEGELRLGTTGFIAYTLAPALLRRCHEDLPHLQMQLQDCRSDEMIERVKSGHVDVAVLYGPLDDSAGLSVSVVTTEPMMVALPSGHRLAHAPAIALGDLETDRFALPWQEQANLAREYVSICQAAGFIPRQTASASTVTGLLAHVASGSCVSLVPYRMRYFTPPGVVLAPVVANTTCSGAAGPLHSIQVKMLAVTRADHRDLTIGMVLRFLQDPTVHAPPLTVSEIHAQAAWLDRQHSS
ncbi:LysR family transcriptional regulator [Mycobacterium sp. CBMA271]|uniref:LysR family transcriptional regulator n=1 Tax=unclassified Mycobacteroides TaxID=2618759 RepID=UPI001328A0B2|nr:MULTISPECIES: LysR substrate-binding domain-containing protein [unclassified Mycobacteroides]MUM16072.1 hypothetical protein [Mycobacteroides sp. CBMA 326]MUM22429.1 LysR family transcriptional regulator [Mycobacteroides sp. CBMA 271]